MSNVIYAMFYGFLVGAVLFALLVIVTFACRRKHSATVQSQVVPGETVRYVPMSAEKFTEWEKAEMARALAAGVMPSEPLSHCQRIRVKRENKPVTKSVRERI